MATDNQVLEHALTQTAANRLNGDPLPGPLADAFCKSAIVVGNHKVRKITASDWVILRQLNSPMVELLQEVHQEPGKEPKIEITDLQEWELCFQFTRPQQVSRELLADGRKAFSDAATEFADQELSDIDVKLICRAVMEQLRRSWETGLKHKADLEKNENISFFPISPPKTA